MRVDRIYVLTGFVWLVLGMVFGVYLGITDQLNLANSHAHANLLGFVISVLFGLIIRSWPELLSSRLMVPQYVLYQVGLVVLIAGKYSIDTGGPDGPLGVVGASVGAVIVIAAVLLMLWIFATPASRPVVDIRQQQV